MRRPNSHRWQRSLARVLNRLMATVLRVLWRSARFSRAGFVLPTSILLLLVLSLTVGALSFRSFSRTQNTYLAREQQVIDNVASPAIDRAKAKLEYEFVNDTRFPSAATPSSDLLAALMLNVTNNTLGVTALANDPYTLPGETRIDINGDGTVDNAWRFEYDLNGDGTTDPSEVVAYSVLMDDAVDTLGTPTNRNDDIRAEDDLSQAKANALVTRSGPINTDESLAGCGGSREPEQGWYVVSTAAVEKNFQVTAYVSNGKDVGRVNSALEFQQVRRATRGNRWGAWFKYDMEIHPGPNFNWNGAIHTDGSMMVTNNVKSHMISSHNSCLYSRESSQITMAEVNNDGTPGIDVTQGDFQGQLVAGATTYGDLAGRGDPDIHIYTNQNTAPQIENANTDLGVGNDSVRQVSGQTFNDPTDLALDPVALFTRNVSQHRQTNNWERDPGWTTNAYNTGGRVINQNLRPPYLDDFYRADDRYGPRPSYGNINWVTDTDDGAINTTRTSAAYDKRLGDEIIGTDPSADNLTNAAGGLDGYWERQAMTNGMRVVVGQRLELGDMLGWNFNGSTNAILTNADPLYPVDFTFPGSPTYDDTTRPLNMQRQRVTLRDNLAAVQGMVVYHYEGRLNGTDISDVGAYPLACFANTVHPGTLETLIASRNFTQLTYNDSASNSVNLFSNYFTGKGTNGWEYEFPTTFPTTAVEQTAGTGENFGDAMATNEPLGIALRNLAYFAGDVNGGSPSFIPVQDGTVHPFPHMAMWGDYSILRRIFADRLDAAAWNAAVTDMSDRYDLLSPADQASLHSAACTLGILANNIDTIEKFDYGNNAAALTTLATAVGATTVPSAERRPIDYITALPAANQPLAWVLHLKSQIARDRTNGFATSAASSYTVSFGPHTLVTGQTINNGAIDLGFDFVANNYFGAGAPTDAASELRFLRLAAVAGGLGTGDVGLAEFPSLYYLFPVANHDQNDSQPAGEEFIAPATTGYIFNDQADADPSNDTGINAGFAYAVVGDDGANPGVEEADDIGLSIIAFAPKTSGFILPHTDTGTASGGVLNPETMQIIGTNGNLFNVALLDKVFYNGREEMAVRLLDLDLDVLTSDTNVADYWIADGRATVSGLFYGAREDALREDSIVRPAAAVDGSGNPNWAACNTLTELLSNACWMRPSRPAGDGGPTDPPLSERADGSFVGLSTKPVDFAPDPDRRPYGFRLNAHLNGNNGDLSNGNTRTWGFTFITDNAAYIKGEFNPHTSDGTNTLEEFSETLFDGTVNFGAQFYNNRVTLNTGQFATDAGDRWRVAEILADAVYLLSNRSVDGAVEEGFIRNQTENSTDFQNLAGNNSRTSFHNQQRPLNGGNAWANENGWLRQDGVFANNPFPIWVNRNAESRTTGRTLENADDGGEFELPNERSDNALIDVDYTERMNATIISGLIPSRSAQGYGGLHNFPRFQEDWNGDDLFIQGAFLQLNFSTAGTGPFDLDAWNPGDTPVAAERINYYRPPNRRWGYDVALQYSPAGPIAQRFVTIERPRSEQYRELDVDDPYVSNLRCAVLAGGARIFPDENCP
jgi:hypothetical protein